MNKYCFTNVRTSTSSLYANNQKKIGTVFKLSGLCLIKISIDTLLPDVLCAFETLHWFSCVARSVQSGSCAFPNCSPFSTVGLVESVIKHEISHKISIAKNFVRLPCFHIKAARFVCRHLIQVHLRQQMVYLEKIRTLYEKPLISQIISNVNHMANNIVWCMFVVCSQIKK